jgi:hypothetical protein
MRRPLLSGVVAMTAAVVLLAVLAGPSQAQYRRWGYGYNPYYPYPYYTPAARVTTPVRVGPAFGQASWVTPYLQLQQQAYANMVIGQSLSYYPPWAFGYNPYPGAYGYNPYGASYTASYVTPYLYGPGFP